MTLTPKACSVHTHADLCDGRDSLEAMAAAAFDAGVRYYGVSCHSHTPLATDEGFTLPANMMEYRRQVLAVREQYRGRMEVLLGLEWDSQSDVLPKGFDYWIGSAHYQRRENGVCYAADWDEASFLACRDDACGGDALAVAEGYFQEVMRVAVRKPTILGHLDLITKLNRGNRFFDESAPRYQKAALEALHAVDPCVTLLEINTGGMARGYRDAPYPALFLLREWRSMGGQIILTSDSHSTDTLLYGYDDAEALAAAAGFDRTVLLTGRGPVECRI